MRIALRTARIVALLIFYLPFHYGWRLAGRPSPWPRHFLRGVGRALGVRATNQGQPLRSNVLFVSNHLSWLDIIVLAGATGAAFVSRDDVARWPVIGWLARMNRTIFVARTQRGAVRDQADALRGALAKGQAVALFPEGTTDGGVEVLPFRASLLASLFPPLPGVRVQPVAIDYGHAAAEIAWTDNESAKSNAGRIFSRRGTLPARLVFLPPIDPAEAGDRKRLAEESRAAIVAALAASGAGAHRL